ncbi:hypothetical protein WMO40_12805 [Bacillaceae bacterium CLA-AA-H227]|uniref:Uncharacterized protein n=1 Tax=Robertmurraya yapensis (ex Hitch et al 2024) TaxID=3133160 RepID=A0ACC6SBW1_9BACI|nr:hypothetical protein [Robertmurraya kyonggiensis]
MKNIHIRSILTVSKEELFDEKSIELLEFMTGNQLTPEQYCTVNQN